MIYLIRHGQTDFNRQGRFQGRLDTPLNADGERQAETVGRLMRAHAKELGGEWQIETSPLQRARRTAEIIAEAMRLSPPKLDERLTEIAIGSWEGKTRAEILELRPDLAEAPSMFLHCPDGEGCEELAMRIGAWLDEARSSPRHVIAVTHAGAGRMMRGLCLGLTVEEMRRLETPQDAVFRLHDGRVERFDCAPLPSEVGGS
jgi:broad specificity phosphatase PhoE